MHKTVDSVGDSNVSKLSVQTVIFPTSLKISTWVSSNI